MPESFLSEAEKNRFNGFSAEISSNEISAHFTLSPTDHAQIPSTTTPANCLGFALSLLCLRYTGLYFADILAIPRSVINYVAAQLGVGGEKLEGYGAPGDRFRSPLFD
jgi:hypothetical protein